MFRLTEDEYNLLRSQIGTSKIEMRGGRTYLPYAFTEQGVAMLSSVLRTSVAEEISVRIMDAFVIMKKYISNNLIEQKYYNDMTIRHDSEIKLLQESFSKLEEKKKVTETYYKGQIYDAYSKILEIFKTAKKELIIIAGWNFMKYYEVGKKYNSNVKLIKNFLMNNCLVKKG